MRRMILSSILLLCFGPFLRAQIWGGEPEARITLRDRLHYAGQPT